MNFTETDIQGKVVRFSELENVMEMLHMIRGGQWDWDRVTYDHKFEYRDTGEVYYLRVQGEAIEGELESPDALIQLMTPILGRHYYPHGVEYDEEFSAQLVNRCKEKLAQVEEMVGEVKIVTEKDIKVEDITQKLLGISGVKNIHELHTWPSGESQFLTCHLIVETGKDQEKILNQASDILREQFKIERSTIQIDYEHPELEKETS